jgi:hypothetical protein
MVGISARNAMLLVMQPLACGHSPVITEERAGVHTGWVS